MMDKKRMMFLEILEESGLGMPELLCGVQDLVVICVFSNSA
jgi:hypothetical protein